MRLKEHMPILALTCLLGLSIGCVKDRLLFATKTVVGLDVDTQPPNSELSINRKEGVIEPVFEGGQTPPVLASFKADMNPFARFFGFGIGSTFATGDAAEALSSLFSMPDTEFDNIVRTRCLTKTSNKSDPAIEPHGEDEDQAAGSEPPTPPNGEEKACAQFFKEKKELLAEQFGSYITLTKPPKGNFIDPTDTALLVFGTDSVLGLKVDYLNGGYPSGVKFGFNRKEVAWAPLARCSTSAAQTAGCFYDVSPKVAKQREEKIVSHVKAVLTDKVSAELMKQGETNTSAETNKGTKDSAAKKEAAEKQLREQAQKQAASEAPTTQVHVLLAPSVLATIDSTYSLETQRSGGLKYQQYFATGRAATNLATHQQVRRALMPEFEDGMVGEMEEFYLWTGNRLAAKLDGLTGENTDTTIKRVYAFALNWKFLAPIKNAPTPTKEQLVKAVKEKMTRTKECFGKADRSGPECKEPAVAKVSKQEMTILRDLLQLCDE